MPRPIHQSRISLREFEVDEPHSTKTLCFSAHVYLDDSFIATASNDGEGGDARVVVRQGAELKYAQAELYARELPALEYDYEYSDEMLSITITLEMLVGHIAGEMNVDRVVRESFDRSMKSRLLLIVNDELVSPKGNISGEDLTQMTDRERRMMFAQVRSRFGSRTIILSELSRDEALVLYRKYIRKQ